MKIKISLQLMFILLSLQVLTACSSAGVVSPSPSNLAASANTAPAPAADPNKAVIPVFPQFVPVSPELQAALAKPAEAQTLGTKIKIDIKFYTSAAKAEDVAAFYNNALKDWKADTGSAGFMGRITMQWTRDNQSFTVVYAPDDTTPGQFLVSTSQEWQ
jgi:hypothetical protein